MRWSLVSPNTKSFYSMDDVMLRGHFSLFLCPPLSRQYLSVCSSMTENAHGSPGKRRAESSFITSMPNRLFNNCGKEESCSKTNQTKRESTRSISTVDVKALKIRAWVLDQFQFLLTFSQPMGFHSLKRCLHVESCFYIESRTE